MQIEKFVLTVDACTLRAVVKSAGTFKGKLSCAIYYLA